MGTVSPIRPGIQPLFPIQPAGQAAAPPAEPGGPSVWVVLGVVFVGIAAYEGVKYLARNEAGRGARGYR